MYWCRCYSYTLLWLLVGWLKFNIPFRHKYGYIRDKRSSSYLLKEGYDILTSTLAAFLFSSHPKRERAHLNYYASAYNCRRQLLHHKTKLNQTKYNKKQP